MDPPKKTGLSCVGYNLHVWMGLLLLLPAAASAGTLSLAELIADTEKSLSVRLAEAEYKIAREELDRQRAKRGWKLSAALGYGSFKDVIDETRSFEYDAIQSKAALSYPLLGSYAEEEREVEAATGALRDKRVKRDSARRLLQLEVENSYATYWGAQESLEVIEAYLATEDRLRRRAGEPELLSGYRQAHRDRERLYRLQNEARARLARLSGRKIEPFVAMTVRLPAVPEISSDRLRAEHPELAMLGAQIEGYRTQLDGSRWYGVAGAFELSQGSVQTQNRGQAGHGLVATISVQLPLTYFNAATSERNRLRAQIEALQLKQEQMLGEIEAAAGKARAEHTEQFENVEELTRQTQTLNQTLRNQYLRRAVPDESLESLARRLREYYTLALEEIDYRTRYWQSHVGMRAFLLGSEASGPPEPTGPETTDVGTRLAEPLALIAHELRAPTP